MDYKWKKKKKKNGTNLFNLWISHTNDHRQLMIKFTRRITRIIVIKPLQSSHLFDIMGNLSFVSPANPSVSQPPSNLMFRQPNPLRQRHQLLLFLSIQITRPSQIKVFQSLSLLRCEGNNSTSAPGRGALWLVLMVEHSSVVCKTRARARQLAGARQFGVTKPKSTDKGGQKKKQKATQAVSFQKRVRVLIFWGVKIGSDLAF